MDFKKHNIIKMDRRYPNVYIRVGYILHTIFTYLFD